MIGSVRIRGQFRWNHVKARVDEGRRRGLKQAGAIVYRRSQSEILIKNVAGSHSDESDERIQYRGRTFAIRRWTGRKVHPSRLTTYRSGRFPKGFMRTDIQFEYDPVTDSVVVGPVMVPWLNALHEFGGARTVRLWVNKSAWNFPDRPDRPGVGDWRNDPYRSRAWTRNFEPTTVTKTARYPKRSYMKPGLDKALPRIAEQFKDQVRGP